jgi:hypothetical protein
MKALKGDGPGSVLDNRRITYVLGVKWTGLKFKDRPTIPWFFSGDAEMMSADELPHIKPGSVRTTVEHILVDWPELSQFIE